MNAICFKLNPKVQKIIETAIASAKPLWFGVCTPDLINLGRRVPIWLAPTDRVEEYVNVNQPEVLVDFTCLADICLISETPISPSIEGGWAKMTFDGNPGPITVHKGYKLAVRPGGLVFRGRLPR